MTSVRPWIRIARNYRTADDCSGVRRMPIRPGMVEPLAARTRVLYADAENRLLGFRARQLADGLDAPTWAERKLAAVQALRRSAQAVVDELGKAVTLDVFDAVAEAYNTGHRGCGRRARRPVGPRPATGRPDHAERVGRRPPRRRDRHPRDRDAPLDSARRCRRIPPDRRGGHRNAPARHRRPQAGRAGRHAPVCRVFELGSGCSRPVALSQMVNAG